MDFGYFLKKVFTGFTSVLLHVLIADILDVERIWASEV